MRKEKEIFYKHLQQHGLKRTAQRDLILDSFLRTSKGHSSVDELFEIVKVRDNRIGYTTIYRTMKLLCSCSLAREVTLGDGRTRFEPSYNHSDHDHLICTRCGKSVEFYDADLERMRKRIAAFHGFLNTKHSLKIFGVCRDCEGLTVVQ
ncbi:MAG: Fur family transcriptional regulator [Acidobacteriota bacterium]